MKGPTNGRQEAWVHLDPVGRKSSRLGSLEIPCQWPIPQEGCQGIVVVVLGIMLLCDHLKC